MLASFSTGLVMGNPFPSARPLIVGKQLTINVTRTVESNFMYARACMTVKGFSYNQRPDQLITVYVSLHYAGFEDVRAQLWKTTRGEWYIGVDKLHLAELIAFGQRQAS